MSYEMDFEQEDNITSEGAGLITHQPPSTMAHSFAQTT